LRKDHGHGKLLHLGDISQCSTHEYNALNRNSPLQLTGKALNKTFILANMQTDTFITSIRTTLHSCFN